MTDVETKLRQIREALRKEDRGNLYAVAGYLPATTEERVGLRVPVPVYSQDPFVASSDAGPSVRTQLVRWEPGFTDGPTSANLTVVDFDTDTGRLTPPVRWSQDRFCFLRPDGEPAAVDDSPDNPWGRQLNAWATTQGILDYFSDPRVLGRPLGWGFGGNRLTLLPHAGFQNNAFYDRRSKALKLYYFGDRDRPGYTSLSHDVLAHEAGHAVLDGIRPSFLEHTSRDTAAFHETVGDLTAILTAFRHGRDDAVASDARTLEPSDFAAWVGGVAEEFGRKTRDRPFLRNAAERLRLADLSPEDGHHRASGVLTGAVFELLTYLAAQYLTPERQAERKKEATVRNALWWAAHRAGRLAFQPLDLLPPADVRSVDYVRAMLRSLEITDPGDPRGYGRLIRGIFHARGFCDRDPESCPASTCPLTPPSLPRPAHFHAVERLSRSPAAAYRFLHDNRDDFEIPPAQDFEIVGLYETAKLGAGVRRLPRQIVVEYLWREKVELEGARFGSLAGETTTLPCGGTLVLDESGNLLSWFHKPGRDSEAGRERHRELLDHLARQLGGRRPEGLEQPAAGLAEPAPPVTMRTDEGGALRFETALHLCVSPPR